MITRIHAEEEVPVWQRALSQAIGDPQALYAALDLPPDTLPSAYRANSLFKLRVPHSYLACMEKGNPDDPLLLQVLPVLAETLPQPADFSHDPVGDDAATQTPGLIHKYKGRVLLITTGACAIHCRYCFRRHFPYADSQAGRDQWSSALTYIADHTDIEEVILSGGDPLTLSDQRLRGLSAALEKIPHVQRLRLHSRLPVVLPERVDDALISWLSQSRLQPVMVIHANHPAELSSAVEKALQRLHLAGVTLLNQSVLLNKVNNDVTTLENLSKTLFKNNVVPYYLHTLDRVEGAAHFQVSHQRAVELVEQLRHRVSGYLVPKLVEERAGELSKSPVENEATGL